MARGIRKPPVLQTPTSSQTAASTSPVKPLNLNDGQALKRALDEAAAKVLPVSLFCSCNHFKRMKSMHRAASSLQQASKCVS